MVLSKACKIDLRLTTAQLFMEPSWQRHQFRFIMVIHGIFILAKKRLLSSC